MPDDTVDPTLLTVAFVAAAALLAGWVDAVVGGGGLVQLPALLLGFPTASPAQILATNKITFISPNVDTATQSVLAKAQLVEGRGQYRSDQFVRARVVWACQWRAMSTRRHSQTPLLACT